MDNVENLAKLWNFLFKFMPEDYWLTKKIKNTFWWIRYQREKYGYFEFDA